MLKATLWLKYRIVGLILLIVMLALALPGLKGALEVNNSLEIWFHGDSPELEAYHVYQEHFGSDEQVLVLLDLEGGSLEENEIQKLKKLHKALLALDEVASVQSPADVEIPERRLSGLIFKQLLDNRPERQVVLLDRFPLIKQQLFSKDLDACKVIVQLNGDLDIDAQRGAMVSKIRATVAQHWTGHGYALGGISVVFAALNELTETQFGQYVPITYLVMMMFLFLVSRNWRVCAIGLATMSVATMLSLGLYGWMGHSLNLMTVLIPMVILLLSSLDLMHLLYAWKSQPGGGLVDAIRLVWKPALLTTLTTMLGFLSLLFSPMAILQQFGLYSAIGIGLCLPLTYLFAAWLWPKNSAAQIVSNNEQRAKVWQTWIDKHRRLILFGFGISLVFFILGIGQLKSDTYTLGYLPKDNQAVLDHERIQATFGSYIPLELLLNTKDGSMISDSAHFSELLALANNLAAEGFAPQLGMPQFVQLTAEQLGAKTPDEIAAKAPQSIALLQKHFAVWMDAYYHEESQTARLSVFGPMMTAGELGKNIKDMQLLAADAPLTLRPAGYLPLYAQLVPYATKSQVYSLLTAALLIGLLLWFHFKSLRQMIVVLATQIFPLAGMFGLMGWLGIELDIATTSIACIGLSYCVDDSIHFALGYRRHRLQGLTHKSTIEKTLAHTGHAIVLSSLMLTLGFACMMISPLKTVFLFGLLSCIMVVLALAAQIFLFGFLQKWIVGENA